MWFFGVILTWNEPKVTFFLTVRLRFMTIMPCPCTVVLAFGIVVVKQMHINVLALLQVGQLLGDRFEVTALARSPDHSHLAVGYRDGYIRVFDVHSGESECSIIFHGHRRAVTALAYDHDGMRLVSGSQVSLCVCVCVWERDHVGV